MPSEDNSVSDVLTKNANDQTLAERNIAELNVMKLSLTADYYTNVSPGISKYYMNELNDLITSTGDQGVKLKDVCIHCGLVFRPGNHTKFLKPRIKRTKKIRQIENKSKSKTRKLGKYQQRLLDDYRMGFNYIVIKCGICGKVTKYKLYDRDARKKSLSSKASNSGSVKLTKKQKKKMKAKLKAEKKGSFQQQVSLTALHKENEKLFQNRATSAHKPPRAMEKTSANTISDRLMKRSKKSKKNTKSSLDKLQEILSKEQKETKMRESAGSLADFLNSLS